MLWLLLALPGLLGLILLLRGWRGRRIDDHPLCRKCRYDLHAIVSPANCPECGRAMSRWRAIRIGHRRKRIPSLVAGALLVIAIVACAGVFAWAGFRGVDLNTYKPLWLLKREACGATTQRASGAQGEIIRRLNAGKLATEDVAAVVNHALQIQGDRNAIWFAWWGDFIEQAWLRGDVSDDLIRQYLRTAFDDSLTIRMRAKQRTFGKMFAYVTSRRMRAGSGRTFRCIVVPSVVSPNRIDHVSRNRNVGGPVMIMNGGFTDLGSYAVDGLDSSSTRALGSQTVSADLQVVLLSMTSRRLNGSWQWTTRVSQMIEVVSPDQEIVQFVRSPDLDAQIAASISRAECEVTEQGVQGAVECTLYIDQPPIDVACMVYLRLDSNETTIGSVYCRGGGSMALLSTNQAMISAATAEDLTRGELILRSDRAFAESTDSARCWEGEIIIPVRLRWISTNPLTPSSD